MNRHLVSFTRLLAVAALAACGRHVILGETDTDAGTTSGSTGGPCEGSPCGAQCAIKTCEGKPGDGDCAVMLGYCTPEGECGQNFPQCFVPCDPRKAKCGNPCLPCDPNGGPCVADTPEGVWSCNEKLECVPAQVKCNCEADGTCPQTACENSPCGTPCKCDPTFEQNCFPGELSFCDAFGACLPVEGVSCPPDYWPCQDKLCGEPCSICPQNTEECLATEPPLQCNQFGQCTDNLTTCFAPCSPGSCGQPCEPCAPDNPNCLNPTSAYCDQYDVCVAGDMPAYCPCAGVPCGMPCTLCDPGEPNCNEPKPGLRACDSFGVCSLGAACEE